MAGSRGGRSPAKLLTPKRGTPGLHRLSAGDETELAVDFGFTSYRDLEPAEADGLAVGDFIRVEARDRLAVDRGASKAGLYTYRAKILRVVDGDTLWLTVRLRGLDCPELVTPEGRAAKSFVESLVVRTTAVTICTTKPDKYDRYLSDVFLDGDFAQLAGLEDPPAAGGSLFLNNALLASGHAVRKDDFSIEDWDEVVTAVPK